MQRQRLTADRIRRFSCPADSDQVFLWDSDMPRLAVRATSSSKSFVFEAKLNRQTIRRTIGDTATWSIDDARVEARKLQSLIDQGIDPRALEKEKAAEKASKIAEAAAIVAEQERRALYTLGKLTDTYIDYLESQGKHAAAGSARSLFKCHVKAAFPEHADAPANEVTPQSIAAIIREVRSKGKDRAAGMLRSYLLAAFNAAKRAPYDASLPASFIPFKISQAPLEQIPTIPVARGNRTLSPEELGCYLNSLGEDAPDQALRLSILAGGQRLAQLLRITVRDYDPAARELRLWDPKGRRTEAREHVLPLAPRAVKIVSSLVTQAKERAANESMQRDLHAAWLFSTHGKVPITNTTLSHRVKEISDALGGEPFNLKDVRRTAETLLARNQVSKDVRAQLLSHGLSGVQTAHYDRHEYLSEKAAALRAWEKLLARLEKRSAEKASSKSAPPGKPKQEARPAAGKDL